MENGTIRGTITNFSMGPIVLCGLGQVTSFSLRFFKCEKGEMILKDKITCIKHMASGRYLISGGCYHSFNPTAQFISTLTKGDDYGVLVAVRYMKT